MEGFNRDLVGGDGYTMPATQHDAVVWLSGRAYDVVFDAARAAIGELRRDAHVRFGGAGRGNESIEGSAPRLGPTPTGGIEKCLVPL